MQKILVVDDEQSYCTHIERALSRAGYEVTTALDAETALNSGFAFKPDLLIVDWMLKSSIDGIDLAEQLLAKLPKMEVILITGFPSDKLLTSAKRVSIRGILEKPFGIEELHGLIPARQ